MSDLISRQAALAAIDKNRDALLSSGMTGAEHILVHYGRRIIEELPSAEKHGKWIIERGACEPDYMVCSCCRCFIEYYSGYEEEWNYCFNCGAKMERSEE